MDLLPTPQHEEELLLEKAIPLTSNVFPSTNETTTAAEHDEIVAELAAAAVDEDDTTLPADEATRSDDHDERMPRYPPDVAQGVTFFLWGSIFGMAAAIWVFVELSSCGEEDYNDDDASWKNNWYTSKVLYCLCTFFYLLEALATCSPPLTRRICWWSIWFGTAALADLLSSLLGNDDHPWPAWWCEVIGMHLFLLTAAWTVGDHWDWYQLLGCRRAAADGSFSFYNGGGCCCCWLSWADALFALGALVDVLVSYGDCPGSQWNDWGLAWLGLLSAVLWFVDALIYRSLRTTTTTSHDESDEPNETVYTAVV